MIENSKKAQEEEKGWRYAGLLSLLIAAALLLSARLVYHYLSDPSRFPINTVKITASYAHVTHKQMEEVLGNYLESSFFSLPVSKLQSDLYSLEWVDKVAVERIWPDTLKIILVEKLPVAIWQDALMTQDGRLFRKGESMESMQLPYLNGPIGQKMEVLQVYQKLSKILSSYGLYPIGLQLRDNLAWELILENGILIRLGKRDIEDRLLRFCKAYPAVFAEKAELLASVDLRYPRGMAVQWKQEAER